MTPDPQHATKLAPPTLSADIAPLRAVLKREPEDFRVDELPLREPEGSGPHTWFVIEKWSLSTTRAVADIAAALGVRPRDIGVPGLKDSHAVTRQRLSVEHVPPEQILALSIPRIRVLSAVPDRKKLRTGDLAGNRFEIRLREVEPGRVDDLRSVLELLLERGVPNYFGAQRFGERADTDEIGAALIAQDFERAVSLIAGDPGEHDSGAVLEARTRFAEGDYAGALVAWPHAYGAARRVTAIMRDRGDARAAVLALDPSLRGFYASAWQSTLFNAVLAARLPTFDTMLEGELGWDDADTRPVYRVRDVAAERARAARFEVSPTGPLIGGRMERPTGEAWRIECAALAAAGLAFEGGSIPAETSPTLRRWGGRRPLRFRIRDAAVEPAGGAAHTDLLLRFTLPPGSYATVVLRELCKDGLVDESGGEGSDDE